MATLQMQILPDPPAVAQAAADLIIASAADAIAKRGWFSIVLSGGSTPKLLYQILASDACRDRINWAKVDVYFGDERAVPPHHADSNYRMAAANLLSKVPLLPRNIHRVEGEIDPQDAAKDYGKLLKARFGDFAPGGGPDVTLLGMGDDGHTASLFPNSIALGETQHRCIGQFVENSTTGASWRITVTAPFINTSRLILPLITGAAKAGRLKEVLHGPRDPQRLPIQLIDPKPPGQVIWLVDAPAAAELPPAK